MNDISTKTDDGSTKMNAGGTIGGNGGGKWKERSDRLKRIYICVSGY